MIVINEMEQMWKEVAMTYFKVLFKGPGMMTGNS
jgi:hypothetical protein